MPQMDQIESLLKMVDCDKKRELIACFLHALFVVYRNLFFTYMEINPLVIKDDHVYVLDLAAKIDQVFWTLFKFKTKIFKVRRIPLLANMGSINLPVAIWSRPTARGALHCRARREVGLVAEVDNFESVRKHLDNGGRGRRISHL